jgi:Fe2+ transport system protein FeoA
VAQITLQEQPVLQYLAGLGIRPGIRLSVKSVAPFGGVVTVRIEGNRSRGEHALGETLTQHILLADTGEGRARV